MQAAQEPAGSIERFLMVAAFAVSGYSSTAGRTSKPFNPLLGETYELVHAEKGFRAVVEKVAGPSRPQCNACNLVTPTQRGESCSQLIAGGCKPCHRPQ